MRLAAHVTLFASMLLALAATTRAETIVKDGDDIIIDGQHHRFVTVDAFEPGRACKDSQGLEYDCGASAKDTLEKIVGKQPVECQEFKEGDRKFSRCRAGDVDLEVALVRAGWAFPRRDFKPYDSDRFAELCAVEKEAREAKRGAWSGTFEIPFVQKGGGRGKKKMADVVCPDFPIAAITSATSLSLDPIEESPSAAAADSRDDVPLWTRVLAALLTPAVAILALVIAWAQWRAVRRREVMELFERRLSIYEALRHVMGQIIRHGTVTDQNLYDFLAGTDRARFLFGQDVMDYIERLYRLLLKHQEAEAMMKVGAGTVKYQQAVQAKYDSFKEISCFYEVFPKLISPYVHMNQKLPHSR